MVTLQDNNGNELIRNITFVKRVNSTNKKEDKNISIQEEKKTYPKQKRKTNYCYNF